MKIGRAYRTRACTLRALGHREQALHNYQLAMVVRGKTPSSMRAAWR